MSTPMPRLTQLAEDAMLSTGTSLVRKRMWDPLPEEIDAAGALGEGLSAAPRVSNPETPLEQNSRHFHLDQ